jgi:hypothetical protein
VTVRTTSSARSTRSRFATASPTRAASMQGGTTAGQPSSCSAWSTTRSTNYPATTQPHGA